MASFSRMFRTMFKRCVSGPSVFSISSRFWVSVLFIEVLCETLEFKTLACAELDLRACDLGLCFRRFLRSHRRLFFCVL